LKFTFTIPSGNPDDQPDPESARVVLLLLHDAADFPAESLAGQFQVRRAPAGAGPVAAAMETRPSVVVVDDKINLALLAGDARTRELPVLFIAAQRGEAPVEASEIISRPFTAEAVVEALRRIAADREKLDW
jgi:uncharacterized protein (DUF1786 family)